MRLPEPYQLSATSTIIHGPAGSGKTTLFSWQILNLLETAPDLELIEIGSISELTDGFSEVFSSFDLPTTYTETYRRLEFLQDIKSHQSIAEYQKLRDTRRPKVLCCSTEAFLEATHQLVDPLSRVVCVLNGIRISPASTIRALPSATPIVAAASRVLSTSRLPSGECAVHAVKDRDRLELASRLTLPKRSHQIADTAVMQAECLDILRAGLERHEVLKLLSDLDRRCRPTRRI